MTKLLWMATSLLLLQAAHSYILLTANIEDFQNVAKRLVQLPISGQVTNIVRRAYDVFDQAYNRLSSSRGSRHHNMRTNERDDTDYNSDINRGPDYGDMDFRRNQGKQTTWPGRPEEKKSQPKEGVGEPKPREGPKEDLDQSDEKHGEQNEVAVEPSEGRSEQEKVTDQPNEELSTEKEKGRQNTDTRRADPEEFSTLGKSASVYLKKIKKIFDENA